MMPMSVYESCFQLFVYYYVTDIHYLPYRVLVKVLHVKMAGNVCHCTRKTALCATALKGSTESIVNKVK